MWRILNGNTVPKGNSNSTMPIRRADAMNNLMLKAAIEAAESPVARTHVDCVVIRVIGRPPSLNVLMRKRNARIVKLNAYKDLCKEAWVRAGRPVIQSPFRVNLHLICSTRKLDPSNLTAGARKGFLDSMTDVKCWENDTWAHHHGPDKDSWSYDPKVDLAEFTIFTVGLRKF